MQRLWQRRLDHYPSTRPRMAYLAIVVLATIVVYYELYVVGAVAPSIIQQYGMSFRYFVDVEVFAAVAGAFASLLAGASDRYGRANLVTYGLLVTGVLTAFAVPNAGNETVFMLLVVLVGFVEGIILVATPAMVRDFSPQLGRAVAMGFWTLGPVVGSLVVAAVSSSTLPANLGVHPEAWKGQFVAAGATGIGVFVLALFFLRELSPNLRDQIMVSARDRALIEAKAADLDVEAGLRHPWRQMLHLDIIGSSFAISVFLLIYYAAVFFFVVYFTTTFGFTEKQANGIADWFWACDAGALVVVGFLSDRLRVRKPFMVLGGVGAIIMTTIFLSKTGDTHTGYYSFVWIVSLLALCLGIAYGPWMAGFTETVERRNPALTATGLAVWGWILRIVVAASAFAVPFVVSAATPLVTYGPTAQAIQAQYPREIQTIEAIDPRVLDALGGQPVGQGGGRHRPDRDPGRLQRLADGGAHPAAGAEDVAQGRPLVPRGARRRLERGPEEQPGGVAPLVVGLRGRRARLLAPHLDHGRALEPRLGQARRRGARRAGVGRAGPSGRGLGRSDGRVLLERGARRPSWRRRGSGRQEATRCSSRSASAAPDWSLAL